MTKRFVGCGGPTKYRSIMIKLVSLLLLSALLCCVQGAAPTVQNTTCSVTRNDYTTYATCTPNTIDPPDSMRKVMAKPPPPNYTPYSCQEDMDSMTFMGRVDVSFSANGQTQKNTICSTFQCMRSSDETTTVNWLNKYAENQTYPCYYDVNNVNTVFFDRSGFCSYRGIYDTSKASCTCNAGYNGDTCAGSDVQPGSSDANTLTISSIVIIAVIATITLFM
ncbi:hypothetical protein PPL_11344 [Heterostelium album PN500]|uniref:EGF-like domain-containing protein n=1 Tax=Heterostelium pallidum (strain ATCC 26659 / Pp 5 / PN500) TaxID=670386 RepID=D3BT52_HETP5|nr:hypothetical protein PPL_11344 [Heterostelium album PN500]EFA75269.1 hypothetical protein PPL_11344 [Heterostelium album PN500]|eukprot:XP_020427403.1 hypothetical protein PPL_11344 [Heterostelium album PN500]